MEKLVSIIIVNYNRYYHTLNCLKTLAQQSYKDFEVLLVDNGSEYKSYLELKKGLKQFEKILKITLIRSKVNLYFTGGNNKALKIANGEYICLLNDDIEVSSDFIEKMVEFLKQNSDIGMIAPKIKVYKNKNYLWYAGGELNFKKAILSKLRGSWEFDPQNQKYNKVITTGYAAGTALFLRKSLIEEIGLLDEIFFMYYEEADWNLRAEKKGYKNYYVPITIVYHKIIPNIEKKRSLFKEFFLRRNTQIIIWKYAKFTELLIFYLKFSMRSLKKIIVSLINLNLFEIQLSLLSLLQGFRIGIKRRTNRSCKKIIVKDYYKIQMIQKRIQLL